MCAEVCPVQKSSSVLARKCSLLSSLSKKSNHLFFRRSTKAAPMAQKVSWGLQNPTNQENLENIQKDSVEVHQKKECHRQKHELLHEWKYTPNKISDLSLSSEAFLWCSRLYTVSAFSIFFQLEQACFGWASQEHVGCHNFCSIQFRHVFAVLSSSGSR